jgi:hypothetical protein
VIKKAVYFLLLIPTAILFLFFGIAFITFTLSWVFSGFFAFWDPWVFGSPNIYFGSLVRFIPAAIFFKGTTYFWRKITS